MKQLMIDMMGALMPFMKTPVLVGGVLAALGLLLTVLKLTAGKAPALGLVAWTLVALGGFYIVCQLMGMYLAMQPTINFGDPRKFEFKTVEFWKIGLAFLGVGVLYLTAAKRAR